MWEVFKWAYLHEITVELRRDYSQHYDGSSHPVLTFSKGDKHSRIAFYPLANAEEMAECYCERIAFDLLVEPLKLSEALIAAGAK